MSTPLSPLHLGIALDGTGWHPASWREPGARAGELLTAGYWLDQVLLAERALADLVTIEDGYALQSADPREPDGRTDQVRGRLDSALIAARVAPLTTHVGLVPTAVVTHSEPFHASKTIATLDYVSTGRAGVRVKVSGRADEAALFGRRVVDRDDVESLFAEAADYVEVIRRLWDSWEDDAEIRDAATGRFVDREKLHYIDFEGAQFSVRGPSITPRPPQGQPVVAALAHRSEPYRLVGRSADVGFVTPSTPADVPAILAEIRAAQDEAGRGGEAVHVFADVVAFVDADAQAAADRLARLDDAAGAAFTSDAPVFTGTPAQLADLVGELGAAGATGVRLRPGTNVHDLPAIADAVVPELQARGLFRTAYEATTLRGNLGLPRPANRYALGATR